jgi:hypothetical protein
MKPIGIRSLPATLVGLTGVMFFGSSTFRISAGPFQNPNSGATTQSFTNLPANAGPGNLWTDIYSLVAKNNPVPVCSTMARQAMAADQWVNVNYLGEIAGPWGNSSVSEGFRGSMRARIICIGSLLPPNNSPGFTAVIIVSGNATGVLTAGPQLKNRFISVAPPVKID